MTLGWTYITGYLNANADKLQRVECEFGFFIRPSTDRHFKEVVWPPTAVDPISGDAFGSVRASMYETSPLWHD